MHGCRDIILRWEKWRIGYNLILLIEGIWILREHLLAAFTDFWIFIIIFAMIANICFCFGPLFQICMMKLLSFFTKDRSKLCFNVLSYTFFYLGLGFSMWLVWIMSLSGLTQLGGSVYYVYTTEFKDKTLAFLHFYTWAALLSLTLIILYRIIRNKRERRDHYNQHF